MKIASFQDDASTPKSKIKFAIKQRIDFGKKIAVVGSSPQLGAWDPASACKCEWNEDDVWVGEIAVDATEDELELKFVIMDDGETVEWQPGENIVVKVEAPEVVVRADGWRDGSVSVVEKINSPTAKITATSEAVIIKNTTESAASSTPQATTPTPTPTPAAAINFEKMNMKQLKAFATEKGVKFNSKTKKADLVAILKGTV